MVLPTSYAEININQLRKNLEIIKKDMPASLHWMSVLKDDAYGHGAKEIGRETLGYGASFMATATVDEALELKKANIQSPVLIFGERTEQELEICVQNQFMFFVNDVSQAKKVQQWGSKYGVRVPIHCKIDTGLSRYGARWTTAVSTIENILDHPNMECVGVMTHFAMSDESDKSFAYEQMQRFQQCIDQMNERKLMSNPSILFHACNSGGYLDLPKAHYDMVRIGILPLGVYPSQVCRRIPGLQPIMSIKTKIASVKKIETGDIVGYGLRYRAESPRTIAVLPMGYSSGFPRLRNKGHVLVHGKKAPIIGGNSMNAIIVDITDILETKIWDDVTIVGRQGDEEISIHDLAKWNETVSYDVMTRLGNFLPRVYVQ